MKLLGSSYLFETLTAKNKNYQSLCVKMDACICGLKQELALHQTLLLKIVDCSELSDFLKLRQEVICVTKK